MKETGVVNVSFPASGEIAESRGGFRVTSTIVSEHEREREGGKEIVITYGACAHAQRRSEVRPRGYRHGDRAAGILFARRVLL